MAIDFNGTTSTLEQTTDTGFDVATFTILAWALADGQGEGGFGRILVADEVNGGITNGFMLCHNNAANQLAFAYFWNSVQGFWHFPATDGVWNAVGVSYDRGATTNDPVARVNFASAATTETSTPGGAAIAPAAGYGIGNRTAADRTWDGAIAHIQFFNVILSAEEMDAGLRRPGSMRRGLVRHWPLYHATFLADLVGGSVPTAANLTTRDGAPTAMLWSGVAGWRGHHSAAAAAGTAARARFYPLLGVS